MGSRKAEPVGWFLLFARSIAQRRLGCSILYNTNWMTHLPGVPSHIDWHWLWLATATFLAGALNAVAGGGSFLSFPAILSMNILPVQANATNTVAIWLGQLTSIAAYREDVRKNLRMIWPMGLAGLLGGTSGALVLLNTPQRTFMRLVPWLLLGAACIFAVSRPVSRWLQRRKGAIAGSTHPPRRLAVFVGTIVIGFYVGYFGAGAGFLLITMFSLFGYQDLHEINGLKIVANTLANGSAFLIFVADGKVLWRYCLVAMIACGIGGYASARFARRIPQGILRTFVVILGLGMAAWFFWKTNT